MIKEILKETGLRMIKLLYPDRCPLCQQISEGICEVCKEEMPLVQEPCCFRCGKPLEDEQEEYCFDCRQHGHMFDEGRGFLLYQNKVRESIHRIKYQNKRDYLEWYGKEMISVFETEIERWNPDVLVAIPMDSRKMRRRGYNQAAILAKHLGRSLQLPWEADVLKKVRQTADQKVLTHQQRRSNLKDAFAVNEDFLNEAGMLPWEKVLLVDDVYTTGSTMDEAAKVLRQYGVQKIYFLTICIGEGTS